MAPLLEDNTADDRPYKICFAGQGIAKLCCSCSTASSTAWYKGRGRPADFPKELDSWVWGGISLATERALWQEELLMQKLPILLYSCLVFGAFGEIGCLVGLIGVLLVMSCSGWLFVRRVIKMNKVVGEVLQPKLLSLGFNIRCHQRPWYSSLIIERSKCRTQTAKKEFQEIQTRAVGWMDGNRTVKISAFNGSCGWDWQGYTVVFDGMYALQEERFPNVWVWGRFLETIRDRTYQLEHEDENFQKVKRLRQIKSAGSLYLYLSIGVAFLYRSVHNQVEWLYWTILALQCLLLGVFFVSICLGGYSRPLLLEELAKLRALAWQPISAVLGSR